MSGRKREGGGWRMVIRMNENTGKSRKTVEGRQRKRGEGEV